MHPGRQGQVEVEIPITNPMEMGGGGGGGGGLFCHVCCSGNSLPL